jgi:crossover junction endodeoxyribonuclease RuvC
MIYIGIDPGKNGGICKIDTKTREIDACKCPKDAEFMADKLLQYTNRRITKITIEKVHSMPGNGVKSMFSFGQNFGRWEGIIARVAPLYYVNSKTWQNHFGIKASSKKERKNLLKDLASILAPKLKVTLAIADAICIARYAYEKDMENFDEKIR